MTSRTTLASLYDNMITSSRYRALKGLQDEFSQKMRFTGNPRSLTTEGAILGWIDANISSTGFDNMADAVEKWGRLKAEHALVFQENRDFYNLLGAEPANSKDFYDLLINQVPPLVPYGQCTCLGEYNSSVSAATGSFQNALQSINSQAGELGLAEVGVELATLNAAYKESLDAALTVYNSCIDDCE